MTMKLSMKCDDGHVQSVEMDRNVPHLLEFTIQAVAYRENAESDLTSAKTTNPPINNVTSRVCHRRFKLLNIYIILCTSIIFIKQ
jgi:hypothetical protein